MRPGAVRVPLTARVESITRGNATTRDAAEFPDCADVAPDRADSGVRRHLLHSRRMAVAGSSQLGRNDRVRARRDHRLVRWLSRAPLGRDERVRRLPRSGGRQADGRGRAEAYLAIIIIGREIAISALREWMAQLGKSRNVAVAAIGKIKTVAQMTALIALLLWENVLPGISTPILGTFALWVAAILTLWSMFHYLRIAAPHFRSAAVERAFRRQTR